MTKGNDYKNKKSEMQGYVNEMCCFTLYVAACSINDIATCCVNNARYLFHNDRLVNDIAK